MIDWTKERIEKELETCQIGWLVQTTMTGDTWISLLRSLAAALEEIARLRHIQAVADAQTSANADAVEEIARLKAEWNLATAEVQAIAARAVQEATRLRDENTVLDHALAAACRMLAEIVTTEENEPNYAMRMKEQLLTRFRSTTKERI